MSATKPAIIQTAVMAWAAAFRVIGAMPLVVGIGLAIGLVISLASFAITPDPNAPFASGWSVVVGIITDVLEAVLQAVLLAPLAIVVHRYVLLGELTNRYPLDPSSARYVRFVGFSILINILLLIPSSLVFIANSKEHPALVGFGIIGGLVLLIIIIIVAVRRAILFPAIAIDAPGATWSNARDDTKGSSWRVAFIFFCVALPAMVILAALYYVFRNSPLTSSIIESIIEIPTLCAYAAAVSHIFRARADKLAQ